MTDKEEDRGKKRKHASLDTTIWSTINDMHKYPFLRVALEMAKENFNLCLSRSYEHVDKKDTKNHLEVIENLKGVFAIDEMNKYPHSYATSGIREEDGKPGVYFNKSLVQRSNQEFDYANYECKGNVDKMLKISEVVGLIAVLQETVEHELSHLKYHQEGINDPNWEKKTPTKNMKNHDPLRPLDGEAGFAVQRQIGTAFPSGTGRYEPCIIGINEEISDDRFREKRFQMKTLKFQRCKIDEDRNTKCLSVTTIFDRELTVDDIANHMDYPRSKIECSAELDFGGPPTGDEDKGASGGGEGSGDGHDGGSGGGTGNVGDRGHRGSREGRNPKWLQSVGSRLKQSMIDAEKALNPPEYDLCSNPENPFWDQSAFQADLTDEERAAAITLCQQCKIKIIPCDENWNEKKVFASEEKIWAKLQITNVTEELVLFHLGMVGSGFGRVGIQLKFTTIEQGYCRGDNRYHYIPIASGQTYTLWRHFTSGNGPSIVCAYKTPQEPGTYTLQVEYYGKLFEDTTEIQVVKNVPEEV